MITIDAIGCQKTIANKIVSQQADYIWGSRRTKANCWKTCVTGSTAALQLGVAGSGCGHGRVEQRLCSVIADLSMVERAAQWTCLQSLVRVQAERFSKSTGAIERETRYYISSLAPEAAPINRAIRQHWHIENKLHWVLDVGFHEDQSRKRAGHAAQNFSLINRIALNLLRQDKTSKRGIQANASRPDGITNTSSRCLH